MKKKILYIHPSSSQTRESQVVIPIGMVGICNLIAKIDSVEVRGISIPLEQSINSEFDIAEEIIQYNPDIVMIDLHWAIYSYSSIELCKVVKSINPEIITILGGITASIFYKEIIAEYPEVNFIIRGDAEHTIKSLINSIIYNYKNIEKVPNIVYKTNGKCIENNELVQCISFNNVNYSDYDFLKNYKEFFKKQGIHKGAPINKGLAWIPTARGCNYNCSYCGGNKDMFKTVFEKKTMLVNSPKNIVSYMQKLYDKYNIDVFGITHTFEIFSQKHQEEVMSELKTLSFKPGFFYYLFQLPRLENIKEMLTCIDQEKTVIGLSVMCGDEIARAQNGKPFTNQQLFDFLDVLVYSKVKVELYFIDNLKYTTEDNYDKTKSLIQKICEEYKIKKGMNIDISYGFEIIQPLSSKHKNNCVLNTFKDYYYRYSPKFDDDISKGKNKEFLIGEDSFDDGRYKRMKEMNDMICFYQEEKKKTDILYICPPSCKQKEFEKTIGIAYLEAYIKEKGYLAKQLIPESLNVDDIVMEILKEKPIMVGFSIYDTNYYYCKLIAQKIKEKSPNITILAGGPTATFNFELILNDSNAFDYCQRGYGEISIVKLLDYEIKHEGSLDKIEGLVYRKFGKLYINDLLELPSNIDIFPSPYLSNIDFMPERKIVLTSRGCVYNCVYCNCNAMCGKKVFYHSVDRVISELKHIYNQAPNSYVLIGDDAFTLNIERAKEICHRIIHEKIKLQLFCETRADRLDDELLELLREAGFIKIDFGLESAVPKVLRNIKKLYYDKSDINFSKEKDFLKIINKAIIKAKQLNLDPMVNIITGLPGENPEDARQTLEFIKKLDINSYSHNYLRIYSGTEIYDQYKELGYKIEQDAFRLPYIVSHPYDLNLIRPLNNSVNRNEIVRIKNKLIEVLEGRQESYVFNKISNRDIEYMKSQIINNEYFIWVADYNEIKQVSKMFVDNLVPSNNINYIIDSKDSIKCFNNLDRENYIIAKKVKDDRFKMPTKYDELLYVEEPNNFIVEKFKQLNVNPYVNKFVIMKNNHIPKNIDYWNQVILDYTNLYDLESEKLIKDFISYIKYDIEQINMNIFRDIINNKVFNKYEIKKIAKFLKYYLLGVIEDDR